MATRGRATVLTQSGWPPCWRAPRSVMEGVCEAVHPSAPVESLPLHSHTGAGEVIHSLHRRAAPAQAAQSRGKLRATLYPASWAEL